MMDETKEAMEMLGKGYHSGPPKIAPSSWSGFTPAPDAIISKCGYVTALVWGKVWRYCQGRDGICRAKLERLGDELGMSERTIIRHLETLEKSGYLKDTTPDLRNKPHIYADTGKVRIGINVEATMTESQPTMTESQRQGDRESVEDSNKIVPKKVNTSAPVSKEQIEKANEDMDHLLEQERLAQENKKLGKSYPGRDSLPESIREFADEFVRLTDIRPSKKDINGWNGEIGDWIDQGAIKADVKAAIDHAKGPRGFLVASPFSLTKTVIAKAAERRMKKQVQVPPIEQKPDTRKMITPEMIQEAAHVARH
jgi:DNA-binding Lrp family transcriptional regulator